MMPWFPSLVGRLSHGQRSGRSGKALSPKRALRRSFVVRCVGHSGRVERLLLMHVILMHPAFLAFDLSFGKLVVDCLARNSLN